MITGKPINYGHKRVGQYACLLFIFSTTICQAGSLESILSDLQFSIEPQLNLTQNYDDNLLYSDTNKLSSWSTSFSPSFKLNLTKSQHSAALSYESRKTSYSNSSKDNYFDHTFQSEMQLHFTKRSSISFLVRHQKSHENRGEGYSQGIADQLSKPDKTRTYLAGTVLNYGSAQSLGRVTLAINTMAYRLDDRPQAGQYANQNQYNGTLTFYYHVRPNSTFLIETYRADHQFVLLTSDNSLDNQENHYYLGATWSATELTIGTVKFGVVKKDFKEHEKDAYIGLGWDIGIKWNPLQTIWLQINTLAQTEETSGVGNYIETVAVTSTISHKWNHFLELSLNAGAAKNSYQPTQQKQGIWHLGAEFQYQARQWMSLSASIIHQKKQSSSLYEDFQKNIYSFSLTLTL